MAKKTFMIAGILLMSLLASSCGQQEENKENVRRTEKDVSVESAAEDSFTGTSTVEASTNNILIAYFTRIDNTDADLDEIVQGGGPYGEIGGSLEEAEADALSSASITVYQGHPGGNTEALAQMIREITGGTLFSIQTEETYPTDYNTLIEQGEEEKSESFRPALSSHVDNMDEYDVIFLGYPNWWQDMPMGVYSFLEEYNFEGKTIIPFAATAGSGFSDTRAAIADLAQGAEVLENGFHIEMEEVADAWPQIEEWITEIGLR